MSKLKSERQMLYECAAKKFAESAENVTDFMTKASLLYFSALSADKAQRLLCGENHAVSKNMIIAKPTSSYNKITELKDSIDISSESLFVSEYKCFNL